jgi:hypothetical protein
LWCPYEFENDEGPVREQTIVKPFVGGFAEIEMLSFRRYLIKIASNCKDGYYLKLVKR